MDKPQPKTNQDQDQDDESERRQYGILNEVEGKIVEENDEDGYKEIDYLKSNLEWDDIGVPGDIKLKLWSHGIKKPSRIQSMVVQLFQKKNQNDILAQSQNGSGKTLAFMVPTMLVCKEFKSTIPTPEKAKELKVVSPLVVIFSDTKELSIQTHKLLLLYSPDYVVPTLILKETVDLEYHANVIVTTMGTFFNFLNKKQVSLDFLKFLVLDETDKLLSQDFGKAKYPLLAKRLSEKNPDCKIGMFSATFPPQCLDLINSLKRKLTKIITQKEDIQLKNLTHYFMKCGRTGKLDFICHFFNDFSQQLLENSVIIFVNNKTFAETFASRLESKGHKCLVLTSNMDTEKRQNSMEDFRAGKIRILITTNLLSRGIDNRKVSVVINLDIPFIYGTTPKLIDSETYLHRVGRTGRFGDRGIAINVVENEDDYNQLMRLKNEYGLNLKEMTVENFGNVMDTTMKNTEYNQAKRSHFEENI